ncbi:hypothetical protein MMYC01_204502 [Madurella mycetomatis]|uniref:Uncharacterized protein n=1 Tax=Madurella mycetomatis TaxID=100816 RepID=A0A175W4A5_9PEZI|nr:hypothetical protein MMYC01_208787 [Madurella mycetomatis]KXX78567.1 hypothetical protein MMYC01_204502 [Madurella mycetomatis]
MPQSVVSVARDSAIDTYLSNASSMTELIDLIPATYRAALSRILRGHFAMSQKISNCQQILATLNRHKSDGTFPQTVLAAIKQPNIQYSKEFMGGAGQKTAQEEIESNIKAVRTNLLDALVRHKTAELNVLQSHMSFDGDEWKAQCTRVAKNMADVLGQAAPEGSENPFASGMNKTSVREWERVHNNGRAWYARAVSLAYVAIEKTVARKMTKLSLKDKADTEMKDASDEQPTASVIDDKLSAFKAELLKELRKKNPAKTSGGPKPVKKGRVTKSTQKGKTKGSGPKKTKTGKAR